MTKVFCLKIAALLTLNLGMLEALASESATTPGQCNSNYAYNTFAPTQVTPQLLEELRQMSGAAIVRHEKPGEFHTQDYRSDRLRVFSVEGNIYSHVQCG